MEIEQKTQNLIDALSREQLNKYIIWADQDLKIALDLYSLNHTVSRALLTSLHVLEIVLRNSVNEKLKSVWGEKWFLKEIITMRKLQEKKIEQVIVQIYKSNNSDQITNSSIVSNLSFGFWTMLFSPKYNLLWGNHLHKVFVSNQPIQRKEISNSLNKLRKLRNSIAHHEAIIHLDLEALYKECTKLIGMLSPVALEWSDSLCKFYETHPGIPIIVNERVNSKLNLSPYRFAMK